MEADERRTRMLRLARQVEEHNIYRWAAQFLTELAATRTAGADGTNSSKVTAL
jgi:trehalose-6-phosphate synthase